jgi:hypothetical protein
MYSRGFLVTGTQFFTDYFLQGPTVEVARFRYPRRAEEEALQVHPAAGEAAQVCPKGRRALYRKRSDSDSEGGLQRVRSHRMHEQQRMPHVDFAIARPALAVGVAGSESTDRAPGVWFHRVQRSSNYLRFALAGSCLSRGQFRH